MSEARDQILKVAEQLNLSVASEFVPWKKSRNAEEDMPSLNWIVTLMVGEKEILKTDYSAGCAHCPSYKQGKNSLDVDRAWRLECDTGCVSCGGVRTNKSKPIFPDAIDVIACLAGELDVLDCGTFEEWAENLGYDTDSRKAEAIYKSCLNNALKLRAALGEENLVKLREACVDY